MRTFPEKLWVVLNDPQHHRTISWRANGRIFLIKNVTRFARNILPMHFRHSLGTFFRQLNAYGFRRETLANGQIEIQHNVFRRGNGRQVRNIRRNNNGRIPEIRNRLADLEELQAAVEEELQQQNDGMRRPVNVLCGAVADAGDVIGNVSRVRRTPQPHYSHRVLTDEELDMPASWKRSHWREMQTIMRREGGSREGVQCCPSVLEMVTMKGGRTPTGLYVELYEDGENQQSLYEVSCAPGVVDRPCRFVDARLYNECCIQKYSYSYALVRHLPSAATESPPHRAEGHFSVPGSNGWSMDYVRVPTSRLRMPDKTTKKRPSEAQKKAKQAHNRRR